MSEHTRTHRLRLAVYGKGGIGKSFVAANLSATFARSKHVIHIGCDPKGDSTRNLLPAVPPVALDRLIDISNQPENVAQLTVRSDLGPDCIEAGGPEPGEGCGGMGILKLFQFLHRTRFFSCPVHDVCLFDVLGDVVCGGFVAPLRFAAPLFAAVVVSEEVHSLFAANQVAKAVLRYHDEGARFAGLILNRRENDSDVSHVHRFARELGTVLLQELPRTPVVLQADKARRTLVDFAPNDPMIEMFQHLAHRLLALNVEAPAQVTPLSPPQFDALFQDDPAGPP
jgi:nitrogenase iron protein NifH